ncbi:hypothetical protein [Polaromonas sp. JS666]|uniref:hypothetical protein n=1 Tax=Polaromonas sp. (strain JS666 / ATCC BAA-500) TaxID=296591 RepID=UPI0000537B6F|nr:hypothetical protein [Polaromonas sp. JS666]ABE43258.1 hypothetical protein Bpro_1308 [Polaromonas sp. JS666]
MGVIQILERRLVAKQARPSPDGLTDGLAGALRKEIAKVVEAEVAKALTGHQAALRAAQPLRPVHSPSPDLERRLRALERRAAPPLKAPEVSIQRDGAGLARAIVINGQRLLIQRDASGLMTRWVPDDGSHRLPSYGPAPINRR